MAEDSDLERTEEASPRRLEEARKKGQVARSRELSTFILLMGGGLALMAFTPSLVGQSQALMREGLRFDHAVAFDTAQILIRLSHMSLSALLAIAPFLCMMLVATIVGPLALSGWLFSSEALLPDFSRLNPMQGITRMISMEGLMELLKTIAKAILLSSVAIMVIWHQKDALLAMAHESLSQAIAHTGHLVLDSFLFIAGSMALLVLIDVPLQMWQYARRLRMTKEEIKQEAKESEGDPHVKGRIRSMQREMARKRMMSEVPKADVVITNPTRFAVALRYEEGKMRAPKLVAKGRLVLAQRIRELAMENGIPLIEAPPLARALHQHVALDKEVPAALYNAVAEVMVYVYRLRHFATQGGVQPDVPQSIAVPVELDPEGMINGS